MTLHKSRPPSSSREFLTLTLNGLGGVCHRFVARLAQVDVQAISPFPQHSLYLAALTQDALWRETGYLSHKSERDELMKMLEFYAKRWGNASRLIPLIPYKAVLTQAKRTTCHSLRKLV